MLKSNLPAQSHGADESSLLRMFPVGFSVSSNNLSGQPVQYFTTFTTKSKFSSNFLEFPVIILPAGCIPPAGKIL